MAETTARPTTRRAPVRTAAAELEDGKARIVETRTKEFIEPQKNETTNTQTQGAGAIPRIPPTFVFSPNSNASPRNSVAYLADVLQDDGEEIYVAVITRLADVFNDSFFVPCFADQNFPPMQFSPSGMLLNFVPQITKFNNGSGGRFSVRVCRVNGEAVDDAVLNHFVVANPPRVENPVPLGSSGTETALIKFMSDMQERNERFQREMMQAIKGDGKNDRFTELAETVLLKKLTEDAKPAQGAEDIMLKMFMMPQIAEAFADKMRDAMNGGGDKGESEPTWMKVMNSPFGEKIGERAGGILEGLVAVGAQMAQVKAAQAVQQQQSPPIVTQPPPQTPQPNALPVQPQAEVVEEIVEETDEMTALIEDIIEELETENPLNDDNEFMKELAQDYEMEATFVQMLCKTKPFEELTGMLMTKAPQVFVGFMEASADGQTPRLSERGVRMIEVRLREFYEYYRAKD